MLQIRSVSILLVVHFAMSAHHLFAQDPNLADVASGLDNSVARIKSKFRPPLRSHSIVEVATGPSITKLDIAWRYGPGYFSCIQETVHLTQAKKLPGVVSVHDIEPGSTALVRNPVYSFQLAKRKGNDWLIKHLAKPGELDADVLEREISSHGQIPPEVDGSILAIDGYLGLSNVLHTDGLVVDSSIRTPAGIVVVKCKRPHRKLTGFFIDCEYSFDPTVDWFPTTWVESFSGKDYTLTVRKNCQVAVSDKSINFNINTTRILTGAKANTTNTKVSYIIEVDDRFSEADFALPAFGLPEPPGYSAKRPTPLYVWLIAVTGVLFGSAVVFALITRWRKRSRPAAKP